jgi:hypothetical protein
MGSGQVGYEVVSLGSFTKIRTEKVEVSTGFSYSEGNSITRDVVDGGFGGMKRPGDVTSKREEVLEGD